MIRIAGPGRLALAALAGAVAALGLAPYDLLVAGLGGFAALFVLWRGAADARAAGLTGWAFATGYFAHALNWIVEPFLIDIARHGWMAPFALVFLAGGLALFWGAAGAVAHRLGAGRGVALLVWLCVAELARAYVLTGFPWAAPGQIWADHGAALAAAWVGPHGLTLLALAAALALVSGRGAWRLAGLLPAAALAGLGALALARLPVPDTDGPVLRILQPNAPQEEKWNPDHLRSFFDRQVAYTGAGAPPDLVIWPETAVPTLLEYADGAFALISEAARGAPVVLGIQRRDAAGAYYNSLVLLDRDGVPSAVYDKHHLVPFGEYMPMQALADRLGLGALAAQAGGFAPGPGPRALDLGAVGRAVPLICYEAVFPQHMQPPGPRPDLLLQITNDAWFGGFSGPYQHLAQARMRAIEQGLPLVRSANTGISAMIDPWGRVTASLPLNTAGFLDAKLPSARPVPVYARTGDWPAIVLLAVLAVLGWRRKPRQK